MSTRTYLVNEIRCDGPGDGRECPTGEVWHDETTAADLRHRSQVFLGWTVGLPGGVDRCDRCSREQQ